MVIIVFKFPLIHATFNKKAEALKEPFLTCKLKIRISFLSFFFNFYLISFPSINSYNFHNFHNFVYWSFFKRKKAMFHFEK